MPEFTTPFCVRNCDKKLNPEELVRAIRFAIAAEYEAIQIYEQLADSIDNKSAKKVLHEIANDEKTHAGNFLKLLKILSPEEEFYYDEGCEEVAEILNTECL